MARTASSPLKFETYAQFPVIWNTQYLYIATDTNLIYRWDGSAYVEVSATTTAAVLTYMFTNIVSDIGATYLQAVSLNSYVVSTKSDQSGTATTSGVVIGRYATNLGFPNITLIPAGTITIHYDTEKGAGANNYYTYAEVYQRNLAGTETLLATSDNSPQTAANTQQSITVTALLASDTTVLSTDRIVVKVVAVMLSSTATIHVYGDDATSARIELPTSQVDATNYMTLATAQTATGAKTFTALATFDTTLGTEKVTNGTPTSSASWTGIGAVWSYSSNSFVKGADGTTQLVQNVGAVIWESYRFVYEVFNRTVGSITPTLGGVTLTSRSADGTYTEDVTVTSTGNLIFVPTNTSRLSIRLISVKKISGGGTLSTNTYPATLNYPSPISAPVAWHTTAWKSNATASAQNQDFQAELRGATGATIASSEWILKSSRNNSAYNDVLKVDYTGKLTTQIVSSVGETVGYEISAPFSNSTPWTTQHIKLSNSGTYSWIVGYFTSVIKNGLGFQSDGTWHMNSANWLFNFYSSATSASLIAQVYSGGFYNNGGNFNAGRVTAGQATTSPPTTFSNYGSTSLQTVQINTPTTLTDSYTQVIVDASTYNVCTGTPSTTDCGTYTGSGQATCESHLPCTWSAGTACSAASGTDSGTCIGQGAGCTWDTASCSGANNTDQTTCESQDDAYGGTCAWDTSTCSAQTSTSACNAISGCTASVTGDCNTLSDGGWDGTNCATQPECSYDSGTWVCSGSYFTSCSGNLCTGTYDTGVCSGVYGAGCYGTATCWWYGDSGSCAAEIGCSWTSGVALTMPANPIEQTYWVKKKQTGGTLTILPNSGDTINGTTSIVSSSARWPWWMLTYDSTNLDWHVMTINDSDSGTYTPTLTNTTNISASTARLATWMRVGNTVTVSGQLDIDPTATWAVLLWISIPIASAFTTAYQLWGTWSSIAIANESYGIEADATNDRASMKNIAVSTANHTVCYSFSYQII